MSGSSPRRYARRCGLNAGRSTCASLRLGAAPGRGAPEAERVRDRAPAFGSDLEDEPLLDEALLLDATKSHGRHLLTLQFESRPPARAGGWCEPRKAIG